MIKWHKTDTGHHFEKKKKTVGVFYVRSIISQFFYKKPQHHELCIVKCRFLSIGTMVIDTYDEFSFFTF